jgi:transposase
LEHQPTTPHCIGGLSKMTEIKTFIRYQNRNKNRPELIYGTLCTPKRENNKKINNEKWLGRVIDKEKQIYYTKELGYYKFSSDLSVQKLTSDDYKYYTDADNLINTKKGLIIKSKLEKNRQIVDFGSTFVIHEHIKKNCLETLFDFKSLQERDTFLSLIAYRIVESNGYLYANEWWENNYLKFIYPYANLRSQRISELLVKVGKESFFRNFFENYLDYIRKIETKNNILIDSTGLPNAIKCPYMAINNHNGVISNEIRFISVIDKITGFPIYYRYVPGNVVDVNTLKNTLFELKEYGVNIDRLILDAGYYSEENLTELYENNIPFMTRMVPRYELYSLLIKKHAPNIIKGSNSVLYGDRKLFIIKDSVTLFKNQISAFAYICCDEDTKHNEFRDYMNKYDPKKITDEQFADDLLHQGIFIIITTIDLLIKDVIPCYYTRQSVEQFFDFLKNDIDLLPLRTHNEQTFSGHLMISFIATIIYFSIDKELKKKGIAFSSALKSLKILHGRIYKDKILPSIPTKKINDIFKALKIKLNNQISL